MLKDLLVFTWLNGQIRFVSVSRGQPIATWECEENIQLENEIELARVISAAVEQTNYRGKKIALVLEHPKLTQQLLETPPATGRDLDLFVERQVDQLKIFDEKAAWSFQVAHPTRGSNSVILYLLPESIRKGLIAAAHASGLHLLMVVSPSAMFYPLIADLPMRETETALLVVEINGTTSLVAGRKDGELFLTRSLQCNWENEPDRVASQINRSTVFIRQQFGVDVSRVHLIGKGAMAAAPAMQEKIDLPITTETPGISSSSWPLLVAGFPPRMSANLITREQQRAPQKRVENLVTAAAMSLLTAAALACTLGVEFRIFRAARKIHSLQPKLAELRITKADLDKSFQLLKDDAQLTGFIRSKPLPAIPAIFLSYLSSKIPSELILTRLQVSRADQFTAEKGAAPPPPGWTVRLEGTVSWQATAEDENTSVRQAYATLANELQDGPFKVLITDRTKQFVPQRHKPNWSTSSRDQSEQFFIEGVIGGKSAIH